MSCAVGFFQCALATIPPNFCCPESTTCNVLAGGTTLLCCPNGRNCNKIQPIPCDITLQDPGSHPDAQIKTTALSGTLPQCGSRCCPFGYECVAGNQCQLADNQDMTPKQSETSVDTTATEIGKVPVFSSTLASLGSTTTDDIATSETAAPGSLPSGTPPMSSGVLRIVIPVVVCVVLASFLGGGFWYWRRRRTNRLIKRVSQTRFEKTELDSEGCEIRRRSAKHELPTTSEPAELPASPVPR